MNDTRIVIVVFPTFVVRFVVLFAGCWVSSLLFMIFGDYGYLLPFPVCRLGIGLSRC